MTEYAPEAPPITLEPELQEYLNRELSRIGDAVRRTSEVVLSVTNVAPTKPEEGTVLYADGVNFNPGSGEGFYGYVNGVWVKLSLLATDDVVLDDVTVNDLVVTGPNVLTGMLEGLTLSNNVADIVNDLDIAPGVARTIADDFTMVLAGGLTKRLDATWTVGNNGGMLASGAALADTTYHVFLIRRTDTGVVDIAADQHTGGANIPGNTNAAYTQRRRIGSIIRAGGAIRKFLQIGDYFWLESPTREVTATNPGIAAVTRTLGWPINLNVIGMMLAGGNATTAAWFGLVTSLEQADIAPTNAIYNCSAPNTAVGNDVKFVLAKSNLSAQVRSRIDVTGAANVFIIINLGWIDYRDRQ